MKFITIGLKTGAIFRHSQTTHLGKTNQGLWVGNIKGTSTINIIFWFNDTNDHPFHTDKVKSILMSNETIHVREEEEEEEEEMKQYEIYRFLISFILKVFGVLCGI